LKIISQITLLVLWILTACSLSQSVDVQTPTDLVETPLREASLTPDISPALPEATDLPSHVKTPVNLGCQLTELGVLGPAYTPQAPQREQIGSGYELTVEVLSAENCNPINGATVEIWLANPQGEYDDSHRTTLITHDLGLIKLTSSFPGSYQGRPAQFHIKVSAPGFTELVSQYFPAKDTSQGRYQIIIGPTE
jgi:protocatechuate 3,4-dioxygenase beta subunit